MTRVGNPRPYVDAQNHKGVGWGRSLSITLTWVVEPSGVASAHANTDAVATYRKSLSQCDSQPYVIPPGLLALTSTAIVRFTCPGKFAQASMTDCKSRSTVLDSVLGGGMIGGFTLVLDDCSNPAELISHVLKHKQSPGSR